jgi:hypothetical protein
VTSHQLQKVIESESFRIGILFPGDQVFAESALTRAEFEPIVGGRLVQHHRAFPDFALPKN